MMVPDYFNSPPSQFPPDDPMADRDSLREHQFFFPTYDQASSSSYPVFFPDQTEPCRFQMHQDHQPQQVEDANHQAQYTGSQGLADHEIKPGKGLKITLWKKSEKSDDRQNPVKWMSSKMRMMQKMKNKSAEHEDNYHHQKQTASNSPQESTDHHFSSSNSSSNNSTAPFRVCSDCNTTKTPLWRSGPKGPKSLCNACGIRQRKARRAMAAAAAAAAAADDAGPQTEAKSATAAMLKIKVQSKERVKNNGVQINTTPFKKRCTKMICGASSAEPSSHAQQKSSVFEDFLINLSKNLAFHRVFPQDEKEAAILLMAISSGLVHS